jgi:2'-5' RNA ligase
MSEQLSLLDPVRTTDRLFFALFPDPDTAGQIAALAAQLRDRHRLIGRPLSPDRFHITLTHLGDYAGLPADLVAKARQAGDRVSSPSFRPHFDRVGSFSGRSGNRPFVLQSSESETPVTAFQRTLAQAMMGTGLGRKAGPYLPHVTLLYDDAMIATHPVEPVAWTAGEFVLVHSLLGQTKHVILDRWPLGS